VSVVRLRGGTVMERNGESVSRAGQERESEGIIVAKGVKKVYDSGKVKVEALRGIDLTGPL